MQLRRIVRRYFKIEGNGNFYEISSLDTWTESVESFAAIILILHRIYTKISRINNCYYRVWSER